MRLPCRPAPEWRQRSAGRQTSTNYTSIPDPQCRDKMTKSKDKKREKMSVATEIDRVEERRTRFQDNIEKAEFRTRREVLSDRERQDLEDEITIMRERVQRLDKDLITLRGENRRNMMLSVALLALSAFFYYTFIYGDEDL
ncbi:coiled-coil domain-containing protein 167 [Gadus macrocephalus]|uniref:coiled-coil domain-containing protein 167 n=1 Tax=Gadus macrocephalus TaxID=80720 RepID=UPI0028CBB52C|nr:coiled-coil domain-containing protein 167 [Gadus macrocephalus]